MDTSGTNIGQKNAPPKPDVSPEELGAILKFGAMDIFKKDADQAKLESMDLDAILNTAESYETTTGPAGVSLGGEDFLKQFEVQDVKADLGSWDEIIPLEERQKFHADDKKDTPEDAQPSSRRPKANGGATAEEVDGASDTNTAQANGTTSAKRKPPTVRKSVDQRKQELKERDLRVLIRGIQRFGDIRKRYDVIVKDGRLEKKDRRLLLDTVDQLLVACQNAIHDNEESLRARIAAGEEISQAIKNKAVLIDFLNVANINAETTLHRFEELRILHSCMDFLDVPSIFAWTADGLP